MFHKLKDKIVFKLNGWRLGRSLFKNVQEEIKLAPDIKTIITQKRKSLWFSFREFIIVVFLFIFFLLLLHFQNLFPNESVINYIEELYPFQRSPFTLLDNNQHQYLISIHAGLSAVLIGLAFFIAQEIAKERDKVSSYKGFIILRRSKFFYLLMAAILFFFLFIFKWSPINILSWIPVFLIGISTIYSLFNTLSLIVDDFELKEEERKLFYRLLISSFLKVLHIEITKLIGDHQIRLLLKEYKNLIEITPFSPTNKSNYTPIKSKKTGVFKDFNLRSFKILLTKLEESAPPKDDLVGMGSDAQDTRSGLKKVDPYCYIVPRYLSDIKEANDVLVWIRNDLIINKENEQQIRKFVIKVFKISSPDFNLRSARNDIRKLKHLAMDLIEDQRNDELSEVLNIYAKLIEMFYTYLQNYGGGFSEKQARDMSMEIFFGGLKPIAWLSEDIREIFNYSIESKSLDVLKRIGSLPVRLLRYSIDYQDHLIFQQFQHYPISFYQTSINLKRTGNYELSNFLFERSWRYLKETSEFYLEPKLKDLDYPVAEVRNFACSILRIFQQLLKRAFDLRDLDSFKVYLSTTSGLFRYIDISVRYENEEVHKLADLLKKKKEEMIFGLSSWIFYKLSQNTTDEMNKKFFGIIQTYCASDIKEFTNVFMRAHSFETDDYWGWDDWEMAEKTEGEAHFIQIAEKLEIFYAVKSLILLSDKSIEEIMSIDLPYSREMAFIIDNKGTIDKTLDDINTEPDKWEFVLEESSISNIEAFKSILYRVKEKQEQDDLKIIREQSISKKTVDEFKNEFLKAFYENAYLRNIFIHYFETYVDNTKEKSASKGERFGFNIVDDKAVFFDEWHVNYPFWGENYGRNLASAEDSMLLDDIAKYCTQLNIKDFESALSRFHNLEDIVIFATNIAFWHFFEDSKNFMPKWHKDVKKLELMGFGGWYVYKGKAIPVFETYSKRIDNQILIFSKSQVGRFVQQSPLDIGEEDELVKDIFYIDIQAFSENETLMEEFIKKPPEWLKKIGDEEKQRQYLQERVRIRILERFEYITREGFIGYKLIFEKD